MPHDPRKALEDMRRAAGRSLDDYRADEILRSVVERKFEIIGEALKRLQNADPSLAAQIPEQRDIISFRNVLIHGYDVIDDEVVWNIVQNDLPALKLRVDSLLASFNSP